MKFDLPKALAFAAFFACASSTAFADGFGLNGFDLPGTGFVGDIVGGTVVSPGDPIAATTVLVTDGNFICTGSLIDTDMVVTAAHCTEARLADMRVIFSTEIAQLDPSRIRALTGLQANPGWKGDHSSGVDQHDIALLRIDGSLPDGYQPANLLPAEQSSALKKGETAVLAGYGVTDAKTQADAGVLREVDVKISKQLGQTEVVLDQRDGKGACHGDSGGPAFTSEGQLWGVTNRGYPDNAPDDCVHDAVYTRIQAYASWIATTESQLRGGNNLQ